MSFRGLPGATPWPRKGEGRAHRSKGSCPHSGRQTGVRVLGTPHHPGWKGSSHTCLLSAALGEQEGGQPRAASCCPGTGPTSPAGAATRPALRCSWTSPGARWARPPWAALPSRHSVSRDEAPLESRPGPKPAPSINRIHGCKLCSGGLATICQDHNPFSERLGCK